MLSVRGRRQLRSQSRKNQVTKKDDVIVYSIDDEPSASEEFVCEDSIPISIVDVAPRDLPCSDESAKKSTSSKPHENGALCDLAEVKQQNKPIIKLATKRNVKLRESSLCDLPAVNITQNYLTQFQKALEERKEFLGKADVNTISNQVQNGKSHDTEEEKKKKIPKLGRRQKKRNPSDGEISDDDDSEISIDNMRKLQQIRRKIKEERRWNRRLCEFLMPLEDCNSDDDDVKILSGKDERPIVVRICYQGKTSRFSMRVGENFNRIVQELSKLYNTVPSNIMLCINEHTICLSETPAKLNLKLTDTIECYVLRPESKVDIFDEDSWITVKIQSSSTAFTSKLRLHKLDPFSTVMEKYSQEHGIPLEEMLFLFDGEKINANENSIELELENDSVIDVRISKK